MNKPVKHNRHLRWLAIAVVAMLLLATAGFLALKNHAKQKTYGLDPKDPTVITLWHYYNGTQKHSFDELVTTFNDTVGLKSGIIVETMHHPTVEDVASAVKVESANGTDDLPDIFAAYADTAYDFRQRGMLVDLSPHLTDSERGEYVQDYMTEGTLGKEGAIYMFPIAKSTELLILNHTDWENFAAASGASTADFATWEGIAQVAKSYYEYTDSLTPQPGDGKAFFGRDALVNYLLVGSAQLGAPIFGGENGKVQLDETVLRKLWDNYYVPCVKGYYGAYGRFRSDDVKTGDLIAMVGSSASASFYPSFVTRADGTTYDVQAAVYPLPGFDGMQPYAVQQGAGMVVLNTDEKHAYASAVFLKWFTQKENNVTWALASGYLPVKKEANSKESLLGMREETDGEILPIIYDALEVGMDMVKDYRLYAFEPFEGANDARITLGDIFTSYVVAGRAFVLAQIEQGLSMEEAVKALDVDLHFSQWVNELDQTFASYL